jgi:uncharacterized protein (TIGR00297 family)
MPETSALIAVPPRFSTRKIVHISMLLFAFLLPFLTWVQAAGCAVLALLFNVFVLPRLGADLHKRLAGETSVDVWTGIVIYPISVLLLILFYPRHLYIAAAVWAIMAWGDGAAGIVGESMQGPALPWNRAKTWSGFVGFNLFGTLGAYILLRWVGPQIPWSHAWILASLTAFVGAIVESLPIRLDDNASVPLICGGFLFCILMVEQSALQSNLPFLGLRVILACLINLMLAFTAIAVGTVTLSGAVMGAFLGSIVYMGWGYKSFALPLLFFVLGSAATRWGYARKAALGVAEKLGGRRSWREAVANLLAGAFFATMVILTHHEAAFLAALIACFAEAAGDTISSELGQVMSSQAFLITTFKPVKAGENGGISAFGTLAGTVASTLIVALAFALHLCTKGPALIALAAAILGNLFDSLLGATIEHRGLVTNGLVNFAGTTFAGALALAAMLLWGF